MEDIVSRLEKVRQIKPGEYVALCPVHGDRHPSLALSEQPDGRVLMYCRSHDCHWESILGALGLDASAVFPPKPKGSGYVRNDRIPFSARALLAIAPMDGTVIAIVGRDIMKWCEAHKVEAPISEADLRAVCESVGRMNSFNEIATGRVNSHPKEWADEWKQVQHGKFLLDKQVKAAA